MGYGFRKSIKLGGGARLNLSKSGVGVSYGVKGCRISTNSKGSTLYAGGHGVYYRKKLSSGSRGRSTNAPIDDEVFFNDILDIEDEFECFVSLQNNYISEQFNEFQNKACQQFLLFIGCFIAGFFLWYIPWFIGAIIGFKKCKELNKYKFPLNDDAALQKLFNIINTNDYYNACTLSKFQIPMENKEFILKSAHYMNINNTKFYFLNNGLLGQNEPAKAYFIPYSDIEVQKFETKVVMFEPPEDVEIIETTWEHTNKDGSPSKRYKVNRQIFNIKAYVTTIKCENNFAIPILSLTEQSADNTISAINDLIKR